MSKKITFEVPEGYALPEGLGKTGDEFDAGATFRVEDDGKRLCLIALDGIPMPGYEKDAEKGRGANNAGDAALEADFARRYQAAMAQGVQPQ